MGLRRKILRQKSLQRKIERERSLQGKMIDREMSLQKKI
jgi:hypothetical protein